VDALDAYLWEESRQQGEAYVRVRVRNSDDYERLYKLLRIGEDGSIEIPDGPLRQVVREGGRLLLDARKTDPVSIEQYNPLYDEEPFLGEDKASRKLQVYVAIPPDQVGDYANTLFSRSLVLGEDDPVFGQALVRYKDPVEALRENELEEDADLPDEAIVLDLMQGPLYEEMLLGKATANEETGKPEYWESGRKVGDWFYGVLVQAVEEGKPFVIHGARWADENFLDLIRQIDTKKQIYVNGELVTLPPDFEIIFQKKDYSKGVTKKLSRPGAHKLDEHERLWIVNDTTKDFLFSRTYVNDAGQLVEGPGILGMTEGQHRIRTDCG